MEFKDLIEITSYSVDVELKSRRAGARPIKIFSRPIRRMSNGEIGVLYKNRLYPLGLSAKKRFLIDEASDTYSPISAEFVELPAICELPYLETPNQYAPEGSNFSWKIELNHFGTYIFLDAGDDIVESFVVSLTKKYKLNIVSWGVAETRPGFPWYIQLPVGLLLDQLHRLLNDYIVQVSQKTLIQKVQRSSDENRKLREELDEMLNENQKLSESHRRELQELYDSYGALEAEVAELRAAASYNVEASELHRDVQKLRKSDAERVIAQILRSTFSSLAFTPDSPRLICEKFANSSMLWSTLNDLNSGNKVPLQKIHGAAGNAGWLELRKHISSGEDARGRIYCRPSKKAHHFDVVLHWKKDSKDQQSIMNALSRYLPFDGPESVLV